MNLETLQKNIEFQYKKAFFDSLKDDLNQDPPKTEHIQKLILELMNGLCKFVPSKQNIHEKIKQDIIQENITFETMPNIILGLINWIETFQSPNDDKITNKWKQSFKSSTNYTDFIITFLQDYYIHIEKVYKEVWDARKRLIQGENIVPPEHRPVVKGKNGVPFDMKTGK